MTKKMPSHSEIVEHWKNKGITSDGEVVNLSEIMESLKENQKK